MLRSPMKIQLAAPWIVLAVLNLSLPAVPAATVEGTRVSNMACDNFYFNAIAGPATVRIDKFAVYAYHQESTRYYVYYHPGEFAGTENDAAAWTLVSTASVRPTGWDNPFELSAGARSSPPVKRGRS